MKVYFHFLVLSLAFRRSDTLNHTSSLCVINMQHSPPPSSISQLQNTYMNKVLLKRSFYSLTEKLCNSLVPFYGCLVSSSSFHCEDVSRWGQTCLSYSSFTDGWAKGFDQNWHLAPFPCLQCKLLLQLCEPCLQRGEFHPEKNRVDVVIWALKVRRRQREGDGHTTAGVTSLFSTQRQRGGWTGQRVSDLNRENLKPESILHCGHHKGTTANLSWVWISFKSPK